MDGVEVSLRLIGAFYAFAGYVATRAALTANFFDRAIAAIGAKKPPAIETARTIWLLVAAALVFSAGVALLLLLKVSVWLFVAAALSQVAYLTYVAPRYFDAADPPDAKGRQQTKNAFIVFAAATAYVIWADYTGHLLGWDEVPGYLLAVAGAAVLGHLGHAVWQFSRPLAGRGDD